MYQMNSQNTKRTFRIVWNSDRTKRNPKRGGTTNKGKPGEIRASAARGEEIEVTFRNASC